MDITFEIVHCLGYFLVYDVSETGTVSPTPYVIGKMVLTQLSHTENLISTSVPNTSLYLTSSVTSLLASVVHLTQTI
jgi:hypothetical protein